MNGVVEVVPREGTFTLYDADGRCVGRVCTETGRAMIGDSFWQRCEGWFVDREALLALTDGMLDAFRVGARCGEGIDAKWCRELHDDYARRIREACGGEIEREADA